MRLWIPKRRLAFGIASPLISLVILLVALSWIFGRIDRLRERSVFQIQVPETKEKPVPVKKKTKPKPAKERKKVVSRGPAKRKPPKVKKKRKLASKPKGSPPPPKRAYAYRGMALMGKERMPAINIYYGHSSIHEYMRALASRGCVFLFRSPLGSYFAGYDPFTNSVTTAIPKDFKSYSPRTRVLAIYGENPLADRIIERAVAASPQMFFPEEVRLIALLSRQWENTLLNAIGYAAHINGIPPGSVESAEATFSTNRFMLNRIRTAKGIVVEVNYLIPS